SAKYGAAAGMYDAATAAAWGQRWTRGSASIIASYQSRSELQGFDRSITANTDYRRFGGADNRFNECNPGNVFSVDGVTALPGLGNATFAAVPPNFRGQPTTAEFSGTAGTLNACSLTAYQSQIPATRRTGIVGSGNLQIASATELFTELMASYTDERLA